MAEVKAKRMWALPGAEFIANAAAMMHGGSLETFTMPVPSYLIEHPKGLVLFDMGGGRFLLRRQWVRAGVGTSCWHQGWSGRQVMGLGAL
jgi:hypothetical protein